MTPTPLMPLGYVDESDGDTGTFSMARPDDPQTILPGTPILIHNNDPRFRAEASLRGEVTETTGHSATFIILDQHIDASWPAHIDPKGYGNPVYLGLPGTFLPDYSRGYATPQEAAFLWELAMQHQADTGIVPMGTVYIPTQHEEEPLDED